MSPSFAFFVWLTLVLPIAYSAYTAESADTARVATWAWPVAQLGDLLLGGRGKSGRGQMEQS